MRAMCGELFRGGKTKDYKISYVRNLKKEKCQAQLITEHTLKQFKRLGLDHQRTIKLSCKLHARSHFLKPSMSACMVPGVLRKKHFLVGARLRIIVVKVGTCDGSKFTTEVRIGSDEFGIGLSYHVVSPDRGGT
eukprot:514495-Pelagomonas_calceolata.AAC.3